MTPLINIIVTEHPYLFTFNSTNVKHLIHSWSLLVFDLSKGD